MILNVSFVVLTRKLTLVALHTVNIGERWIIGCLESHLGNGCYFAIEREEAGLGQWTELADKRG